MTGGSEHTCVLTAAGGVKCWGRNWYGNLGDGTTNNSWLAVDVVGLGSGVQAIAASWSQTCALTAEGSVKCWGRESQSPVEVAGLGDGAQAIAVGSDHACAVTAAGGVKCWGANYVGQLGNGGDEAQITPVDVSGLDSGVQALAAGTAHTCALSADGIFCWGANHEGQLGDGSTVNRLRPVAVAGLEGNVRAIVAGDSHTCALLVDGSVKCWGSNTGGQLGIDSRLNRPKPVDVPDLAGVQQIVAGAMHNCALAADESGQSVQCWGTNYSGELGDGSVEPRVGPVAVVGLDGDVTAIGAGVGHSCALLAGGGARCWGSNWGGQLGAGSTYWQHSPVTVTDLAGPVRDIAAGEAHTCVLAAGSDEEGAGVVCWGAGGALGNGKQTSRYSGAAVTGLDSGVQAIAAGSEHTCALTIAGAVQCWGGNTNGQLGDGTKQLALEPVGVIGLDSGVQFIAAGRGHTCAVTEGGGVKCWGDNAGGQLGDGTQVSSTRPVDVVGLSSGVTAVAAGLGITCALTDEGGVKCWGAGRVGDGTLHLRSTPVDVVGLAGGVQAITAGNWHACALTAGGAVKCWGSNQYGQLGIGNLEESLVPLEVLGLQSGVQELTAGGDYTCAITADGELRCWGWEHSSLYMGGSIAPQPLPASIRGIEGDVQAVAIGGVHTCVLAGHEGASATAHCWGINYAGQLGVSPGWSPVDVLALLPRELFTPLVRSAPGASVQTTPGTTGQE
jgi:alpha-tubulin suppressor-like RCC1 family protein